MQCFTIEGFGNFLSSSGNLDFCQNSKFATVFHSVVRNDPKRNSQRDFFQNHPLVHHPAGCGSIELSKSAQGGAIARILTVIVQPVCGKGKVDSGEKSAAYKVYQVAVVLDIW